MEIVIGTAISVIAFFGTMAATIWRSKEGAFWFLFLGPLIYVVFAIVIGISSTGHYLHPLFFVDVLVSRFAAYWSGLAAIGALIGFGLRGIYKHIMGDTK